MHIVNGAVVALFAQPISCHLVAIFGTLAQREERLMASHARSITRDAQHLFRREIRRLQTRRRLSECAVAAPVATQHGQRDKHLRRERDARAVRLISHLTGRSHELVEWCRQQIHRRSVPVVSSKSKLTVQRE